MNVWISDDTTYLIHSFNQPIEIDQAPQQEPKQSNPCKSGIYTHPIFTIYYLLASNFILTFYYLQIRCSQISALKECPLAASKGSVAWCPSQNRVMVFLVAGRINSWNEQPVEAS